MGPAPIPPHERSWRHPSELAPTAPAYADVVRPSSRWSLALATGAVAVAVVAVFAITTTPGRTSGPVAMSATTLPAYSVTAVGVPRPATSSDSMTDASIDSVRLARPLLSPSTGLALMGAPKTVAAPVPLNPSRTSSQPERSTDPNMTVHLITESHVYQLSFGDLERVLAPDASVVVDGEGLLLGSFEDGRFIAG